MTSTDFHSMLDSPSDAPTRGARKSPQRDRKHDVGRRSKSHAEDDRLLVARLLQRDAEAWTEFLRRFERLIVSRVMSTCREIGIEPRSDLVEDCGAELMANLFHNDMAGLRRFEGRSKLSTWLTVVVRRTALRIIHRRLRDADKIAVPDSRFDFATIAGANDSEDSPYDTEDNERLQAALQQLSASDRQIIELQFDQQLSYSAIGQIFNISENAVGPKLHRAQTRLKKLLKRQEDE